MNLVHIKLTFKDVFSGAIEIKYCTRSEITFNKMKEQIGNVTTVSSNYIKWEWELIKVEQA
jgi:hypothetical protein